MRQTLARSKKPEVMKAEPEIRPRDEKTEDERPDANSPEAKKSISPADGRVLSETG